MSAPFITVCPSCGVEITVPYDQVSHHVHKEQGKLSAAKRKDFNKHLSNASRKRWETTKRAPNPRNIAILKLSKHEDINKLTLREIADKVGITGPHRQTYVSQYLRKLQKKGLLSPHDRRGPSIRQAILDLAQREGIGDLTYKDIADKIGYEGQFGEKRVQYHIARLQKEGLVGLTKRHYHTNREMIHMEIERVKGKGKTIEFVGIAEDLHREVIDDMIKNADGNTAEIERELHMYGLVNFEGYPVVKLPVGLGFRVVYH